MRLSDKTVGSGTLAKLAKLIASISTVSPELPGVLKTTELMEFIVSAKPMK
jgi:hypothetical protein